MLTCLPASICSWDYRVTGGGLGEATLRFNWMSEQGSITVNHVEYAVVKHGVTSGRWSLETGGQVVAVAAKPSAFFRAFEVSGFGERYALKACSPFSRTFEVIRAESCIGRIAPAHAFTRRGSVEVSPQVHELVQLFCFWLVALMWKRASDSDGAGGAGGT